MQGTPIVVQRTQWTPTSTRNTAPYKGLHNPKTPRYTNLTTGTMNGVRPEGVRAFLEKYGYGDMRGRADRINFGGVHRWNQRHPRTGLVLRTEGFNCETRQIENADGGIILESDSGEIAAKWEYSSLIDHWKRKHNRAAYIPSQRKNEDKRYYRYGKTVKIGEGTDFHNFLLAISRGKVYYDPGIKMEDASSSAPKIKRRSQFRIKTGDLRALYDMSKYVNVTNCSD